MWSVSHYRKQLLIIIRLAQWKLSVTALSAVFLWVNALLLFSCHTQRSHIKISFILTQPGSSQSSESADLTDLILSDRKDNIVINGEDNGQQLNDTHVLHYEKKVKQNIIQNAWLFSLMLSYFSHLNS